MSTPKVAGHAHEHPLGRVVPHMLCADLTALATTRERNIHEPGIVVRATCNL